MREILGRRRKFLSRRGGRPTLLEAALTYATEWHWPVLPGVGLRTGSSQCGCLHSDCAVPGAHPFDPGVLAATSDARMVRWWWTNRPSAPILLGTGRAACAVSLPAVAGARALAEFDRRGVALGPVVATRTRWSLLVEPYSLAELGDLLYRQDWVPSSLRFHGDGGFVVLPPSRTGGGPVRLERPPRRAAGRPWLPRVGSLVDVLVAASTSTPGGGSRLTY